MRVGQYEIVLLHGEDAFAERLLPDGKFYASAEPSREYSVQVNIYRDIHGSFPAKYIRIGLYVDGYDVQYWKRIDFSDLSNIPKDPSGYVSSRFWGFKEGISDVRAFKFAEPTVSSEPRRSHQKPLGSIRMVVHAAYLVGGVFDNKARTVEGSIPAAADPDSSSSSGTSSSNNSNNVYEGKKFWQQASLTTATGAKIAQEKEQFNPVVKWLNTSETPIAEMTLYYHTKSTLDLLEQMQLIEMGARASAPAARGGGSEGTISSVGSKRSYTSSGVARVFGVSEGDNANAGEDGEEEVGGGILSSGVVEHTRIVVDLTGDDDDTADTNGGSSSSGSGRDGHTTGAGSTTASSSGGVSSTGAAARNIDASMSTIRHNGGGGSGYSRSERAGFVNSVQSAQPEGDTGATAGAAGAAAAATRRALAMGSSRSHEDSDIQPVEVIVEDAPPLSY